MNYKENDTTGTMPSEKFELYKGSLDLGQVNTKSESDFVEIEFPKSRTIRLSKADTIEYNPNYEKVIEFTANYEKIDEQMKNFLSNNAISK